jgi:hypothetical protein
MWAWRPVNRRLDSPAALFAELDELKRSRGNVLENEPLLLGNCRFRDMVKGCCEFPAVSTVAPGPKGVYVRTLLSPHWGWSLFSALYPRLTAWAAFFRGFAAEILVSPQKRGPSFWWTADAVVPRNFLSFELAGSGFFSLWLRRSRCTTLALPAAGRVHRFRWAAPD